MAAAAAFAAAGEAPVVAVLAVVDGVVDGCRGVGGCR